MHKKKCPPVELQILLVYYVECPHCLYENVFEGAPPGNKSKGAVRCEVCKRKVRWEIKRGETSILDVDDLPQANFLEGSK